jgi:hypothetical protein
LSGGDEAEEDGLKRVVDTVMDSCGKVVGMQTKVAVVDRVSDTSDLAVVALMVEEEEEEEASH